MNQKTKEVAFANERLRASFEALALGKKFEDIRLFKFINRAMEDIKNNPFCGTHVPKDLIPEEYIKNYAATNLWKYDLPNAWRLLYTITTDKVKIVGVILEWMDHKNYERRFGY